MAVCRRVDGGAFIMPLAQAFFGLGRRVHASRAQARRCRGRAGNQKFGQSAHRPLRPRTVPHDGVMELALSAAH